MNPQPETGNPQPATAVVVNDDPTQLNMLAGLLRKAGIDPIAFENAEAALAEMNAARPPDLIVTDLYMPGIDGWRFCRLLRSPEYEAFNAVPILVVSATFSGDEASAITADLGANAFLPSPVDGRRFIDTVRALRSGEKPKESLRVLVVEDGRTLAGLLAKRFEDHGYRADVAYSRMEASIRFAGAAYDIAVLDYHLPDGLGDELLQEFLSKRPNCVCVMITTDPDPKLALSWMKAGAAAYLRKPFDPEFLIEQCTRARRERALLRVEDLLEERTKEHRLLLDTIDTQVWYLTDIETYGRVNRSHAAFLGLDAKGIAYKRLAEFVSKEVAEVCKASNMAVFHTKKPVHTEEWIPDADGEERLIAITKTPKLDADGNVEYVVCAGTDITERVRLQQRLRILEKNESLDRMAGAIAHLFNNHLAAVIGNLELLEDDLPPGDRGYENLKAAQTAARRAAETSGLMLTFLGRSGGKPAPVDLAKACRQCIAGLEADGPMAVEIRRELPDSGPVIRVDRSHLDQIISVLITNGLESMEKAGEVRLSINIADASNISHTHRFPLDWEPNSENYACLTVADTGRGMDDTTIGRIFDPFFTDKFTGRGLGLPVVLGILKASEGGVTVESEPGRGSVFRVFFPLHKTAVQNVATAPDVGPGPLEGTTTVLLADDMDLVRNAVRAMLVHLGFDVITARDGVEAVDIFRRRAKDIRLVLTDLSMPGLNGWEVLKTVHDIRPDIPVILASGYDEATALDQDRAFQPQGFLNKPFQMDELKKALAKVWKSTPESTKN